MATTKMYVHNHGNRKDIRSQSWHPQGCNYTTMATTRMYTQSWQPQGCMYTTIATTGIYVHNHGNHKDVHTQSWQPQKCTYTIMANTKMYLHNLGIKKMYLHNHGNLKDVSLLTQSWQLHRPLAPRVIIRYTSFSFISFSFSKHSAWYLLGQIRQAYPLKIAIWPQSSHEEFELLESWK